jgi:hypothetical protein
VQDGVYDAFTERLAETAGATAKRRSFKITARDLGDLKPGLSLDNVAELIERVEGPLYR